MNSEILTNIILLVIVIIGGIVSTYVIPFVRSKMEESEYAKLVDFIKRLVRCANQVFEDNDDKKEYVLTQATKWLKNHKINITYSQLDAIIEGIVNEIKRIDSK